MNAHHTARPVEGPVALTDQTEARLAQAQRRVDALTASLVARDFRGQLVPQDPNDVPATVALERTKQERART